MPAHTGASRRVSRQSQRRRTARWVGITVAVVLVALIGAGVWLGLKVLTVRNELMAAQASLSGLRDGDAEQGLTVMAEHGARAAEATDSLVWTAAEYVPWAGDNLRAARLAAETLDALAGGLGVPALNALKSDSDDPMLTRVLPVLQSSAPRVHELNAQLQDVGRSDSLVSQLRGPIEQVAEVMGTVDPVLQVLPGMLGADGERNYLLVGQSNAETLALGGSAASQSLLHVSDGELKIVKQADSKQYQWGVHADVEIDQSALDLYNEYLINNVNTAVGRPDWPTAARTIIALWHRDIDPEPVDGAVSIDPLAMARIMRATGPVTVDGRELTSDNVVAFLLSDAYELYEPGESGEVDGIFKEVAVAVMDSVVEGDFDPGALVSAVRDSIDAGSLMFWSADPEIQEMITPWRLSGVLPASNLPDTVVGVYFRDASLGSKIDYYMRTEAEVTATCNIDGTVTYDVSATVGLDLTKDKARTLSSYVTGGDVETKIYRTQVFLYGPPGTKVTERLGETDRDKAWKWRALDMEDLGRPTPSFMTVNPLGGETVTVGARFTGPATETGPLDAWTTPMVHPTKVTVDDSCSR
ncbi:DUF4012 domain-containing protein [Tessaracoccus caeni]|uniref:DUF4012 domain-containing protein n=1 Tax=Tessaracoccus caeni TaxID=3031239 RepID=UPI0023DBC5D9|nr:DUF4012 domain-containing protein [Tessaracoccus caeni]MDF1488675.1 DUF4012 domain-containing protein [Tessaracoccus caeni]